MNPRYVWPAVVLALAVLAGVVVLAALHSDTSVFLIAIGAVATPILIAFGAGQLATVKEQTNGALSRLLGMLEEAHRMLAAAHVPPSALAPPPGGGTGQDPATAAPQTPPEDG